ncbi:MAG TPA: 6-bladed beta-propeller [Bacteroidales bacterium]|nr:6-bladed beta-propeller [Bacteroidales bacterium]
MNKFLTLIFLILIAGCGRQDTSLPVIDTQASKPRVVNLSEIFEKDEMIILETSDSCLLTNISQVIKTKDAIYVLDNNWNVSRIGMFDRTGRFIRWIGRMGNGPEEYHFLSAITLDSINQKLIAVSEKDILEYKLDGSFIQSYPTGIKSQIENIYVINDTIWLFNHDYYNTPDERKIIYFYYHSEKKDSIILNRYKSRTDVLQISSNTQIISQLKESTYIYFPVLSPEPFLRDTLYEIKGKRLLPALKLDFSSVLKVSNGTVASNLSFNEWKKGCIRLRNITLNDIYRTHNFLFADYTLDSTSYKFCYDFTKQDGFNMEFGFHDDLFGTGQFFNPKPMDLYNGRFYYSMNSISIKDVIPGINEESNPVLFFLKIKT